MATSALRYVIRTADGNAFWRNSDTGPLFTTSLADALILGDEETAILVAEVVRKAFGVEGAKASAFTYEISDFTDV